MIEDILICQCGDPSHQLVFRYDDTPLQECVYVSVHLTPVKNIFKRLWYALKYVFSSKRCIYGDFDEIILRPDDACKIENVLNFLKKQ
jgi:hypothetical protein